MKTLLLTSGGYIDGQRGDKLDKIIERLSKNKKVLIIDNATLTGSNVKGVPVLVNNFKKIASTVDVISLDKHNLSQIKNYDVIYITGGDLTPLIELANQTKFRDAILSYWENGGIVIGESAGSIIFADDIKYCYDVKRGTKPKYDVVLPTYKGLGISSLNIYPHWDKTSEEQKAKVLEYEKATGIHITKMADGEWQLIGDDNTHTQDLIL